MAGIDGDYHVATPSQWVGHGLPHLLDPWIGGRPRIQIHDQPVPVTTVRLEHKALGTHRRVQIQNHPQVAPVALGTPNARNKGIVGQCLRQLGAQLTAEQIDYQAIRVIERKDLVVHAGGNVEHQARIVRGHPVAYPGDLNTDGPRSKEPQRNKQDQILLH